MFSMLVYLVQNISVLDFGINNIAIQTSLVNLLMNLFVFNIVVFMPIVFLLIAIEVLSFVSHFKLLVRSTVT